MNFFKKYVWYGFGFLMLILLNFHFARESGDFKTYLTAASHFLFGSEIYNRTDSLPFVYFPMWAIFFIPFLVFSVNGAIHIWSFMNVAMIYVALKLLIKQWDMGLSQYKWIALFSLLSIFYPISKNFINGQINILILFFLILAVHFFHKKIISSFFFALVMMAKISPLLFLPYFIIKKQFRLLFYTLGWIAFDLLFPSFFSGWDKNLGRLKKCLELMLHHPHLPSPHNHALTGILYRHFGGDFLPYKGILFWTMAFIFASVIFLSCRKPIEKESEVLKAQARKSLWYEISIVLLSMFFITPIVWEHHLIILLPTLFLIVLQWPRIPRYWKWALVTVFVLFNFSSKTFVGYTISRKILFDHGIVLFTLSVLFIFLLFGLRENRDKKVVGG